MLVQKLFKGHDSPFFDVLAPSSIFFRVVGPLIISKVSLTDSISSSSFSRVLPPAAMPRSTAACPCCPARPDIRSIAPLLHPHGRCGGRGNSTLVIGSSGDPRPGCCTGPCRWALPGTRCRGRFTASPPGVLRTDSGGLGRV